MLTEYTDTGHTGYIPSINTGGYIPSIFSGIAVDFDSDPGPFENSIVSFPDQHGNIVSKKLKSLSEKELLQLHNYLNLLLNNAQDGPKYNTSYICVTGNTQSLVSG